MLTGRTRFRAQRLTGLLVMQVEVKVVRTFTTTVLDDARFNSEWRDARTEDLASLHALTYGHIQVSLAAAPAELPGERRDPRSTTH